MQLSRAELKRLQEEREAKWLAEEALIKQQQELEKARKEKDYL